MDAFRQQNRESPVAVGNQVQPVGDAGQVAFAWQWNVGVFDRTNVEFHARLGSRQLR
jgi:hypothetical protein